VALATLLGFALQRWLGVDGGLLGGLLAGMLAANAVPLRPCADPGRDA
jgi:hypothetical protein